MSDAAQIDASGQGGKKAGSKKLLIIGGAAIALLLVAGGGAFLLMGSGGQAGAHGAVEGAEASTAYFLELPQITVNLNTGDGPAQYLRMSVALELSDQAMASIVEPRMPRVLDAFQVYLRELRPSDLEGSAGIYRLREELQRRVNLAIHPATIEAVLFKEILVQ